MTALGPGRCGAPRPAVAAARSPCSAHPAPARCAGGWPSTSQPPAGSWHPAPHCAVARPTPTPSTTSRSAHGPFCAATPPYRRILRRSPLISLTAPTRAPAVATVRVARAVIVAAYQDAGVAEPTRDRECVARTVRGSPALRSAEGAASPAAHRGTGSPPSSLPPACGRRDAEHGAVAKHL